MYTGCPPHGVESSQRAGIARASLVDLVEGFSTDSVRNDTVYTTIRADADSDGPGSTRGRTHGSFAFGVQTFLVRERQSTSNIAKQVKTAQQHAARSMGHAQKPHDAAETPPIGSPATSVIVAHTTTPASFATRRPRLLLLLLCLLLSC